MQDHPWTAVALFAFVSSITPGPNNVLATASGARFGLRRTLPQVAGVTFGFTLLLALAASGVAAIVGRHPTLADGLALVGYLYLGWLAYRLLDTAWRGPAGGPSRLAALRPMTFVEAALFQSANPKAWMMALSAATGLLAGHDGSPAAVVALCAMFTAINFPCVGAWAVVGSRLSRWLGAPGAPWRMRTFNASMGATLLATTAWMAASR